MNKYLFFFLFLITSLSEAQLIVVPAIQPIIAPTLKPIILPKPKEIINLSNPGCDLDTYSLGSADSSPLQKEAELILSLKGYNVVHREIGLFGQGLVRVSQMMATYAAGAENFSTEGDCLSQEFEDLGKFYSCNYELTLFTMLPNGDWLPVTQINESIRDARNTDRFYDSVYNQLKSLPYCL